MEKFEVTFLGCGSALPTLRHRPSAQAINIREKYFLVDCGEGTQLQIRKMGLNFSKFNNIFISHIHGDHCFGLIGLISTFSLLGRKSNLNIYAPKSLFDFLEPQIQLYKNTIGYLIKFHTIDTSHHKIIYEDKSVEVWTIPLSHRIPCSGFLFKEKPLLPHIKREMIDFYGIPIAQINNIKNGMDWVDEEGHVINNAVLTKPSDLPRSYAYCSDTAFDERIADWIKGVDVLYHEATFEERNTRRAVEVGHSTASQAATIAKLAECKKLILGHYSARYQDESQLLQEAQAVFKNTMLSNEGLKISVSTNL